MPQAIKVFLFCQWMSQWPRGSMILCVGELGRAPLVSSEDRLPSSGEAGLAPPSLCLSACHGSSTGGPNRATMAFATVVVGR